MWWHRTCSFRVAVHCLYTCLIIRVHFRFPILISPWAGLNKTAKTGITLVVLSFMALLASRYQLSKYASPSVEVYLGFTEQRALMMKIMMICFYTMTIGALILFLGTSVRTWQKRFELFPFLFKPRNH